MARQAHQVVLTGADRAELESWTRKGSTEHRLAQRARIILMSAEKVQPKVIATTVGLSETVVHKWRRRFREEGIAGLKDRRRPGQPRKLSEAKVKEILRLTVESGVVKSKRTHS